LDLGASALAVGGSVTDATLPVTVVVPVRNEARNLPTCLASIPDGLPILVVDSGSTDDTVEIARRAGAEVLEFHWQGGYPKKRNWVLATYGFETPWVLFLDADERLTDAFLRGLEGALGRTDVVGYWLNYHNHFMGKALRHGDPQRKLALFRVGAGVFERVEDGRWSDLDMEVHEHPILNGPIGEIAARLDHEDFRGVHKHIDRHNDYSSWEARRYQALSGDPTAWAALTNRQKAKYRHLTRWWFAPAYFLFAYVWRRGFLDGSAGLSVAWLKSVYFSEVRLKIIELNGS
jgi:glycosyltransferase involved in cell wall biosynthesis